MAEEGASPPRRRDSVMDRTDMILDFERPHGRDRKSLTGMSDSVKAILAPLLGGKKSYSKVEVDSGRESSSSLHETVTTGSTSMQRYSTMEAEAFEPAPPPSTTTDSTPSVETSSPSRMSTLNPRTSRVYRPGGRGTGPQEMKGKYEETTVGDSSLPDSPIDPAFARVDNFMPATKPKMKEYDEYIRETAPQLRARVDSILGDKSHERKLPEPELEEHPSLLDKVKDTVTGQVPGHGIYSGKEGSGVPGPKPNEEHLHDNMDAVDRLRDTVAATRSLAGDDAPVVSAPEGGLPRHPRSARSSTNTPQGAPVRRGTLP